MSASPSKRRRTRSEYTTRYGAGAGAAVLIGTSLVLQVRGGSPPVAHPPSLQFRGYPPGILSRRRFAVPTPASRAESSPEGRARPDRTDRVSSVAPLRSAPVAPHYTAPGGLAGR